MSSYVHLSKGPPGSPLAVSDVFTYLHISLSFFEIEMTPWWCPMSHTLVEYPPLECRWDVPRHLANGIWQRGCMSLLCWITERDSAAGLEYVGYQVVRDDCQVCVGDYQVWGVVTRWWGVTARCVGGGGHVDRNCGHLYCWELPQWKCRTSVSTTVRNWILPTHEPRGKSQAPNENAAHLTFQLLSVKTHPGAWPRKFWDNKYVLLLALKILVICYS